MLYVCLVTGRTCPLSKSFGCDVANHVIEIRWTFKSLTRHGEEPSCQDTGGPYCVVPELPRDTGCTAENKTCT